MLPCEDGYQPEVGAIPEDLFEVVVGAYREAILIRSPSEHGSSERFCKVQIYM